MFKFNLYHSFIVVLVQMLFWLHIMSCILYNPRAWLSITGMSLIFGDEFCTCSYESNNFTCTPKMIKTEEDQGILSFMEGSEPLTLSDSYPVDSWVRLKKIPIEAHPACGVEFYKDKLCMPIPEKYSKTEKFQCENCIKIG